MNAALTITALHRFLGHLPKENGAALGVQPGATATGNDDAAEVQSAAPVEQSLSTAK